MPPRSLNAPTGEWFSCLTKTSAPVRAQSSGQRICGVGGIDWCTSSAAASKVCRSGRSIALTDLQHGFDLDRDVVREAGDTQRGAGMAAGFAEHFNKQVGAAIDHRRMLAEI